jgi:peptidoglycan/xylan/chitin deacetylase (PgdA/CDA1 family)
MITLLINIFYRYHKLKFGEYPLSILYYHHVFENKHAFHTNDMSAEEFEQQINYITKTFNILPLNDALALQKKQSLPPKALAISFDDGYLDNFTIAAPILKKYQCPATFFIATDGIDKGYLWNDIIEQALIKTTKQCISKNIINTTLPITTSAEKITAFHTLLGKLKFLNNKDRAKKLKILTQELQVNSFTNTMMNKEQIQTLHSQGYTIGAHTHNHTILATENKKNCIEELSKNKSYLEDIIKSPVEYLAFPNGLLDRDFTDEHCKIAQQLNFKAAFSTNDGGAISSTNTYQIPRFMPFRKQLPLFALSIAKIAGEHV